MCLNAMKYEAIVKRDKISQGEDGMGQQVESNIGSRFCLLSVTHATIHLISLFEKKTKALCTVNENLN